MDTKLRKIFLTTSLAALIFIIGSAQADDTDVYMNPGAGLPAGSEPMVMFSLDYRPNLGSAACNGGECNTLIAEGYMSPTGPYTFFDVLRGALRKVFDPLEGVRVGLMLNHSNNSSCEGFGRTKCSNGGYIAMGFDSFLQDDGNGAKARFHAILDSMPTPQGNLSHSYQGKELFFEFFRYLTGQGVYNAHNGYTDYGTSNNDNLDVDHPAISWDTSIETGAKTKPVYDSPMSAAGSCSKIYTVNTVFQVSNQDDDSDAAIEQTVASGGFGSPQREFPDVVQYLNDADLANGTYGTVADLDDKQNVVSYFIVDSSKINTTTKGYARAGGTGVPLALDENPDELVATLQEIFKQILSVSTTFVAASVPVNVFNRAEITDNVYIALFQVDGQARPYWVGNVKKLKLTGANDSSATATLVDATGTPAIAADGRIRFDALTSWTVPASLPPPDVDAGEVAGRDGRVVNRGGAGQRVPGFVISSPQEANGLGGRTIYYDRTTSTLAGLNVDAITATSVQADLNAATAAEAAELIAYARGLDIDDLDGDAEKNEARDWIFGDALHSRPLPLNYGSIAGFSDPGNPAIYLAVATNDGMLRMIRNTTGSGSESGEEVWAFMPRAAMAAQKVLRANGTGMKHPYTVDGAPVAFMQDVNHDGSILSNDGDRVYLYVGMRRGGKAYYAFDVTNPENPDLMWTIDKSGDFAELGYTFSNPRVGLIPSAGGPRPVVMFAGGYDTNKDTRGSVGTDDSEGNSMYVVDAETGALIWKARGGSGGGGNVFEHPSLVDSIPSTLSVADTNGDGFTDRMVVGDTGGNIWRADIQGSDVGNWKLTLLASVGRHASGASGIATDRRFFHRPDLVPSKDGNGLFDAVVVGSGNRADPLDKGGAAVNYTYMIKDRRTASGSAVDSGLEHADFGDVTSNCLQTGGPCAVNLTHGWRLGLEDPGEKVLATPLTITGMIFFTTYLPHSGTGATACAPSEGAGRLYAVSLQDAKSVINYDSSDDDPDNPDDPSTKNDRSVELQSLGIPAEVVSVPPNKILRPDLQIDNVDATTRWRTYWFLQEDADL
ncbi:MAG: PilC/PilY family type IV pilus protein [Gammaproteobacteria bacterium]|nr:PilC/PilY family type IV pilus protein [Gammaproteobacteria bacterium]MDH3750653.1 PilC/PilY family type IV pilus protein [Gammaproteobacteria bacterium]MDH3804862.1 PilC/PilY family type IV pilus protein [Gammaproteobacteria bacterium]